MRPDTILRECHVGAALLQSLHIRPTWPNTDIIVGNAVKEAQRSIRDLIILPLGQVAMRNSRHAPSAALGQNPRSGHYLYASAVPSISGRTGWDPQGSFVPKR